MDELFVDAVFMRHALDAVPSIVLVADEDARILYRNRAAKALLAGEKIYGNRIGEIMHCIHAEDVPAGCGRGPHCKDCLVRNSINASLSGQAVTRRRAEISVKTADCALTVPALISSSPFSYSDRLYALLVIEDVSELTILKALLPICAACNRIRSADGKWERVETYIKAHLPEANFSHSICPDCARKLYPKTSR